MDSRVESDRTPVLGENGDSLRITNEGSLDNEGINGHISYDIDTSSTCFPRSRSAHAYSFSGSWRSNSDVDMRPVLRRASSMNGSLDASLSMSLDGHIISAGIDEESIFQAVVFIEDAYNYRSINHKVSPEELRLYRWYRSRGVNVVRMLVITLLHLLAFVEYPSSLTWTSDPRYRHERVGLPCWLTQSTELLCLLLLLLDNIIRIYLMGVNYFIQHKWDMLSMIIIIISFADWCVSFGMGCKEFIRFRRILRPYFLLQNSSLMKKIVRCLRRTMPEVISVLMLMLFHLYIFTLLGMLIFPEFIVKPKSNSTMPHTNDQDKEGSTYFKSLLDSFISLLVLLTTANNPDVTIPAYSRNRLAALFFILYLIIGLYFFMNVLLAVIYNQFRGYFLSSLQSSLRRRRLGVRAAFEVLQSKIPRAEHIGHGLEVGMGSGLIRSIITRCNLPKYIRTALLDELDKSQNEIFSATEFQTLFRTMDKDIVHKEKAAVRWFVHPNLRKIQRVILHNYFTYFGMVVVTANLLVISVELSLKKDTSLYEKHSMLRLFNFAFVIYYLIEQLLKLWANGWARYISEAGNVFDAVISLSLMTGEIVLSAVNESPFYQEHGASLVNGEPIIWNIIRMINILIMVRMFKILPYIQSMNLVASVLLDLLKNMKAFLGISVVCFYAFAIFGIELFHGTIKYEASMVNQTFECGSYEQLEYWANNFDDFYASIVVLWDVMVVNNWMVFLYVFERKTTPWSYLYFIAWWLLSVIIVLNLFTALIMENFIMKWDRRDQLSGVSYDSLTVPVHLNTVHSMFKDLLQEPADSELLESLMGHHYLRVSGRDEDEMRSYSRQDISEIID
ncbi:hypothetical protein RRG08_051980 [Elysia crispata]|uniref:Ion transport domain-containing protein n=1 Tax=Elysia crispata TaxID=231223 RepID=A0AAE0ZDD2_9GAST|nr:hypothetical protein RRG08_051980 [Elysia crispata]